MLRLRTLGECAIEIGSHRIGPEADVLFATGLYLAVERGTRVARTVLIDLIWPDVDAMHGRHCLRQALYRLRQSGATFESTTSHILLAGDDVTADFDVFLRQPLDSFESPDPRHIGDFLPGYAPVFSARFAEWVEAQREFVHGAIRRMLVAQLPSLRSRGEWARLDGVASACLRFDPLNEEATLARAEATALSGSKREAVAILDRYLADIGPEGSTIRLPATVLRKRIGEQLSRARFAAATETEFVGRSAEMATLSTLITQARDGSGGGLMLWGDPGIGKSRLAAEAAAVAALDGVRLQRVACQESDQGRPLSIFVDLVPSLRALPGALGCDPESLTYLARLTDHDPTVTEPSPDTREVELLASNVRRALYDLFDAVSEERPLIVIIEDVHWLDRRSWQLVRELVRRSSTRRSFFLLTARANEASDAEQLRGDIPGYSIGPLDDAHARALVTALAHAHGRVLDGGFLDWCVSVAERNPLFLRELALQWVSTGTLDTVPATVQSVLDSRLSGLSAPALRLLQATALLGKHSTFERLERVLELPAHEMLDNLEAVEARGLIASEGSRVECRHQLVLEAALRRLPPASRRLLHRAIGRAFEAEIDETQSASLLWDCAWHWGAAEEEGRALRVARSCARHSLEVGLPNEAAEILERALGLCRNEDETLELFELLATAQRTAGRWMSALDVLRQIRRIRNQQGLSVCEHDDDELFEIEAAWYSATPTEDFIERLTQCVFSASASQAHKLKAAVWAMVISDHACDFARAERIHALVEHFDTEDSSEQLAKLRVQLVYNASYGNLEQALAVAQQLLRLHRRDCKPTALVRTLSWTALPARRAGDFDTARSRLSEALDICLRYSLEYGAMLSCIEIAACCIESSSIEEAQLWYPRAIEWSKRADPSIGHPSILLLGARLALMNGDPGESSRLLAQIPSPSAKRSDVRFRTEWLATSLGIGLMEAESSIPAATIELEGLHRGIRSFGGQDFPTSRLIAGLRSMGRNAEAEGLLNEYVTVHRRERSPLPTWFNHDPKP